MIISQGLSYSLRVGSFLALQSSESRFSSTELAEQTNIPKHYCSKVLKKLVDANILTSVQGRGGGFAVAKDPSKIRFYDLFLAIETEFDSKECVFGLEKCGDSTPCPLHFRWKELKEYYVGWAKETTLLDVINDVNSIPSLKRYCRK